jgi:hypothetical protein
MQEGLPLAAVTVKVFGFTAVDDLHDMAAHHFPSFDLSCVFIGESSTGVIPAIPLKPTTWIMLLVDPSLLSPDREWLAGVNTKIVQFWILFLWT